jgi:SP family general alpha glucoside:H+ symporter-like MFS transporter
VSSYKVLFASEWTWPGILLCFFLIIPESPYHLVRKGNLDSAAKSLQRLYNKRAPTQPILDKIVQLIREETFHDHGGDDASYIECFRGSNWRRTRIILYANGLSQMIGATFIANAPYFMITAGLSPTNTAMMVEMGIGFALISSAITFWLMTFVGRRKMILSGVCLACLLFLIMGIAGSLPTSSKTLWYVSKYPPV